MKDRLFLMKPGFSNAGNGPFYCGDSVSVEGLLGFFPQLRAEIDVEYLDFPRPRVPLVELLGADHQSIPVIVLAPDSAAAGHIEAKSAGSVRFLDDEKTIRHYLSEKFDLPTAS